MMENVSKNRIIAAGLAVFACLLWSTAFAGVKIGLEYFKPLGFAGIRFMISGMILMPFAIKGLRAGALKENLKSILLISLFQTFILYALFYLGINIVPASISAIIIGSSPVISAIVAHFAMEDDRLTLRRYISFLFGVGGIVLIAVTRNPLEPAGFIELLGIMALLGSSISSAVGNVIVARNKTSISPVLLASSQIFLGGLMLFLVSIFAEGIPDFRQPPVFYGTLAWLSLLSASAFSIWFTILKKGTLKVSEINMWKFIIPVSGAVLSWIILPGESPGIASVTGMILVSIAILII